MIKRLLRMTIMLSVTLLIILLVAGQSVIAAKGELPGGHVKINEVFVDFDSGEIIITGEDFDFGDTPEVTLGEFGLLDIVRIPTATEIVVSFPDGGLPDGDYLLTVATGSGQSKSDEYDLTIGAVGPQGEQGKVGPPGPNGVLGVQELTSSLVSNNNVAWEAFTPTCPSGKTAISGGIRSNLPFTFNNTMDFNIADIHRSGNRWRIRWANQTGTNTTVTLFTLCAFPN
jgi:hypothetical protein